LVIAQALRGDPRRELCIAVVGIPQAGVLLRTPGLILGEHTTG